MKRTIGIIGIVVLLYTGVAAAAVGVIDKLEGEVLYREGDNLIYKPVKKGLVMEEKYWLKTGGNGWAVLLFGDGSKMTFANDTEFRIDSFKSRGKDKSGVFDLMNGKMRAAITKLPGSKIDYKVKSPTAVAGIRGTDFMMMTKGEANVLFGNEGKVAVFGDSKDSKPLTSNTMVQNTRGNTPIDPVKLDPDSPLASAKKDFEKITAATPPSDWEASNNLPNIIAR